VLNVPPLQLLSGLTFPFNLSPYEPLLVLKSPPSSLSNLPTPRKPYSSVQVPRSWGDPTYQTAPTVIEPFPQPLCLKVPSNTAPPFAVLRKQIRPSPCADQDTNLSSGILLFLSAKCTSSQTLRPFNSKLDAFCPPPSFFAPVAQPHLQYRTLKMNCFHCTGPPLDPPASTSPSFFPPPFPPFSTPRQ